MWLFWNITKKRLFISVKIVYKKRVQTSRYWQTSFEKIKEIADNFGYAKIRLTVNKNNKHTIDAYLKYRFTIIAQDVTDIGNGFVMDDYIMEYTSVVQ